jgi:hypothetical protein
LNLLLVRLRRPILLVAASVLTAWCFVIADALVRDGWPRMRVVRHFGAALALYAAGGAFGGLLAAGITRLEVALSAALVRRFSWSEAGVRAALYGSLAAAASASTAFWTFSGEKARRSALAGVLPFAFIVLVGVCGAVLAHLVMRAFRARREGSWLYAYGTAALLCVAGVGLLSLDLHLFIALYSRLHTLLEVTAALLLGSALALLLDAAWELGNARRWMMGVLAVLSVYWLGMLSIRGWTRIWLDEALRHVWLEPAYVGRMLQRLQVAEGFLKNPVGYEGVELSRLARLKDRFDIASTARHAIWDQPFSEPPQLKEAVKALRKKDKQFNVLVFYVDTLRQDVAGDSTIMPSVARFAEQSLTFTHAYSPGSDTIRALPGLSGGSYDVDGEQPGDLLAVARKAQMESVLVIAQSAREFLAKLRPSFRFDQTVVLSDYAPEKEVWGYGADGPTAGAIVDKSLEWLGRNRDSRFFLWLFNFDVHAWRELDERYVKEAAFKYGVPDEAPINWRYRVVARAVDEEFGRLLRGLKQLGLHENTIVLFVSDHGEALGRDGFWVHSIFLWECLIRVPLVLHVPGLAAKTVHSRVSLVDVAPTLARYMLPEGKMAAYHGEDLVSYLVPQRPKRRLPILTQATSQQQLVRVGIVDPDQPWKLVLSFESARPELYDLKQQDPDANNVTDSNRAHTLRLLSQLVRSPVFPRFPEQVGTEQPAP